MSPLVVNQLGKRSPHRRTLIISFILGSLLLGLTLFALGVGRAGGHSVLSVWQLLPFGIVGLISWGTWLMRWVGSRWYQPTINNFRTTTSVVVPSYREDPDITIRCLESWLSENPDEIIMVVDVADVKVLERLRAFEHDERLRVIPFEHRGKRSALGVGIRAAKHEILILTDSDTSWEKGLVTAVQMPFVDPSVGGVSTRQNAILRDSSIWRVIADWLVNIRYLDYVPIEGMFGGVACLSGRTAAYRRAAVLNVVDHLEHEYFMGKECVAGDDGRLTWLILGSGYKTVYQSTARAWSMFPNELRAFIKQRIRWSRNSYRCYITSIKEGWLWRQPLVTQIRVFQILLTPFSQGFALLFLSLLVWQQNWTYVALGLAWVLIGRGIRSLSHFWENPRDIYLLPIVALVVIGVAFPIKIWAFFTMNTHGWLTRHETSVGGEGQTEASLYVVPELLQDDVKGLTTEQRLRFLKSHPELQEVHS
ncbi:MAG: glycosyltransferase [Chloroflexota bacterium]